MARCLIIGCGCRGRSLAAELRARGHAVRASTRHAGSAAALESAGAEAHVGDPERVATLAAAFEQVSVVCVLLGSASGSSEHVRALHGPRLEMLLARMLDTTVRGIVYEAAGTVDREVLAGGAELVRRVCEGSRIPYALLCGDAAGRVDWRQALMAVLGLLEPPAQEG